MSYWAAAQLQPQRDQLALHCLQHRGFETYPRPACDPRMQGDPDTVAFPRLHFRFIDLQWSPARWSLGVVRLVMDGVAPARVPASLITALKAREVGGLIELPPPPPRFRRGDYVRILRGPLAGKVGLFAGMRPKDRVVVLLSMLGGSRRVELPGMAVERWP